MNRYNMEVECRKKEHEAYMAEMREKGEYGKNEDPLMYENVFNEHACYVTLAKFIEDKDGDLKDMKDVKFSGYFYVE